MKIDAAGSLTEETSELREARNERESVLMKYINLYDFAPAGYFTLARDGNINALNITGSSLLGGERSGLIGRNSVKSLCRDLSGTAW